MIAASARTSGTRAPFSSSLKRGSATSFACLACRAALARAAAARRLRAVDTVFLAAAVDLSVRRFLAVELVVFWGLAANAADGPKLTTAVKRQISRTVLNSLEV